MKGGILYVKTQKTFSRTPWSPLLSYFSRWYSVMRCVNPRKLRNPGAHGFDDAYITASCGRCYACLSNRRRIWLFRLKMEQLNSSQCFFVTLTYNDDNCDGDVHKEHVQRFFKRLRKSGLKFRYYCIGEFGTHTHRPHYHVVFFFPCHRFNNVTNFVDYFSRFWSYGFISASSVSYRRLNYILHYHTRPKVVNDKKTFQLFSKGLGIDWLYDKSVIDWMVSTKSKVYKDFNGQNFVIPRYYRKKLVDLGFQIDSEFKFEDQQYLHERICKVFGVDDYNDIPIDEQKRYLIDLWLQSERKINKYNIQDKL